MICHHNRILDILTIIESALEQLDFSSIRIQCIGLLYVSVWAYLDESGWTWIPPTRGAGAGAER